MKYCATQKWAQSVETEGQAEFLRMAWRQLVGIVASSFALRHDPLNCLRLLTALAGEERTFEEHINGAIETTAAGFGRFGRVVPLNELTAVAGRESLKRLPGFRVIFQAGAQVGRNGKDSRSAVDPQRDAHHVAGVGLSRFA